MAVLDLFGEIPVTWPEAIAWVRATVGLEPESWRWRYYFDYWHVVEKIQAAKAAGTFDAIISLM